MASGMRPELPEQGTPSPDAIREQLERMLASKAFATSPRLSKFLQFGVETALAGRQAPNEYSIGVDAFERSSHFDPRLDPIVRVHARRLRSRLAEYYNTEGAEDPIKIILPLRSYIPIFAQRPVQPRAATSDREAQVSSIAVYPFVSLSTDKGEDYFAEGLTHEVVHSLSKLKRLRVVSLAGQDKGSDLRNLPWQVNVQSALSGSVRRAGNRVRISAELVNVGDKTVLWSQMYELALDDFIATQERIASAISHALSARFDEPDRPANSASATAAYDLYRKAQYACQKCNPKALGKCVTYLQQSIAVGPDFARAHALMAEALVLAALYAEAPPRETLKLANQEAQSALAADVSLSSAHMAAGLLAAAYSWNLDKAEADFLRAIEIAPASAAALDWYGTMCLAPAGRLDEAVTQLQHALKLDPLRIITPNHLAFVLCAAGQPDAALTHLSECIELDPNSALTHSSLGLAYVLKSDYRRAIAEFETSTLLPSGLPSADAALAHASALAGDRPRAETILQGMLASSAKTYVSPLGIALAYVGLGNHAAALQHLEAARDSACPSILHVHIDPRFAPLRAAPRFGALLKSIRPRRELTAGG